MTSESPKTGSSWRQLIHNIIFETDTRAGKWFDILLIASIVSSVVVVILDSVALIRHQYGQLLYLLEWLFTGLFTLEYCLRLVTAGKSRHYAFSFYGLVDLFAILPTYLGLLFPGSHYFSVIRILRVLRIFRILKLLKYVKEAHYLLRALKSSRRKITVFLFTVLSLVVVFGAIMYVIEGPENGFTSIPKSMYWAVVTLTTVGYGDISPSTNLGQTISALIMILGYSILAVPTGIVSVELARMPTSKQSPLRCPRCGRTGHDSDARYCKQCGHSLPRESV
jgi:voltage-gated potassium channel